MVHGVWHTSRVFLLVMLVFYLVILALTVYGLGYERKGSGGDYLSRERCNAIKGLFIMWCSCAMSFPISQAVAMP